MGKITLEWNEKKQVIMAADPVTYELFIQVMFTGILSYMEHMVEAAQGKKLKETLRERLYDTLNVVASNALAQFAPELELRPDLTAMAILEKENEILNRTIADAEKVMAEVDDAGQEI